MKDWYRFGMRMRMMRVPLIGIMVELGGHLLSSSFLLLLIGLVLGVGSLRLDYAGTQAKAAHQRLDALVPKVGAIETTAGNALPKSGGTITGNLVTNGSHTLGGALIPSGGTLSINGSAHVNSGGMTVDDDMTVHGNHNVDSDLVVGGDGSVTGTVSAGHVVGAIGNGGTTTVTGNLTATGGSTVTGNQTVHGSASVDGNISANNFGGPYQGGQGAVTSVSGSAGTTYSQTFVQSIASAVNGCIARLDSSGLI